MAEDKEVGKTVAEEEEAHGTTESAGASAEAGATETIEEEPSAAELQERIAALEDENKQLKADKEAPEEKAEPKAQPTDDGQRPISALQNFANHTVVTAKQAYVTAAKQAITVGEDGVAK